MFVFLYKRKFVDWLEEQKLRLKDRLVRQTSCAHDYPWAAKGFSRGYQPTIFEARQPIMRMHCGEIFRVTLRVDFLEHMAGVFKAA